MIQTKKGTTHKNIAPERYKVSKTLKSLSPSKLWLVYSVFLTCENHCSFCFHYGFLDSPSQTHSQIRSKYTHWQIFNHPPFFSSFICLVNSAKLPQHSDRQDSFSTPLQLCTQKITVGLSGHAGGTCNKMNFLKCGTVTPVDSHFKC